LALAGLAGILLFAYLRRSAVRDDPESVAEVDAFGHELDKMSVEFPAIIDRDIAERKQ
jgi:hypothetical protein